VPYPAFVRPAFDCFVAVAQRRARRQFLAQPLDQVAALVIVQDRDAFAEAATASVQETETKAVECATKPKGRRPKPGNGTFRPPARLFYAGHWRLSDGGNSLLQFFRRCVCIRNSYDCGRIGPVSDNSFDALD
jgi:hypothetical protein